MKIVVIGNGPAAVSAVEVIRSLDRATEIVMIAREDVPFYSPCPLAEYIEGAVPRDHLFLRDEGFYRELEITTMFGREVTHVDAAANEVALTDGERVAYDQLLIAAGARAVIPPIPGLTLDKLALSPAEVSGVFVLKTLADAEAIRGYLNGAQRAVVIGAGFIGLEAAQALARRGLSVTVVEALDRVLPQMLDAEMAALVQSHLESNGVRVMLDSPVEAVPGEGQVTGVVVGGQEVACELVVCAAGVRPNLALVEGTDIATNVGILVDERMETSHPGVFAAGDIVEAADIFGQRRVLPTWPNAVNGGRVAGYNLALPALSVVEGSQAEVMAGAERRFTGLENTNVLRVFDLPVVSLGRLNGSETLRRAQDGVVKKLALEGGRVVGLQMVGQVDGAGLFLDLMIKGRDVTEFGEEILSPTFGYGRLLRPAVRDGKGIMALRAL